MTGAFITSEQTLVRVTCRMVFTVQQPTQQQCNEAVIRIREAVNAILEDLTQSAPAPEPQPPSSPVPQ